jgi:hypothetical protein
MDLFQPAEENKLKITLTDEQLKILKDTNQFVKTLHDNFDISSGEKIARLYFAAVDLNGFCIDLDEVYSLVGYGQKGHAKTKLKAPSTKLREGIDYIEYCEDCVDPKIRKPISSIIPGGRNKIKIMMTSRGFSQFALSARTDQGAQLRDFIHYLTVRMKILVNNEVAQNNVSHRPVGDRAEERLLACESQKSLMEVATSLGIPHKIVINGESNFTVTGKRKKEMMQELGLSHKKPKSVISRNYMTNQQLKAINLIEECTKKDIESVNDPNEIVEIHKQNCLNVYGSRGIKYLQSQQIRPKLDIINARKQKEICDK